MYGRFGVLYRSWRRHFMGGRHGSAYPYSTKNTGSIANGIRLGQISTGYGVTEYTPCPSDQLPNADATSCITAPTSVPQASFTTLVARVVSCVHLGRLVLAGLMVCTPCPQDTETNDTEVIKNQTYIPSDTHYTLLFTVLCHCCTCRSLLRLHEG
jgi:hypothetical protein